MSVFHRINANDFKLISEFDELQDISLGQLAEGLKKIHEKIRLRKIKEKIIRKKRIVRNKTCLICKDFMTYYNYKNR